LANNVGFSRSARSPLHYTSTAVAARAVTTTDLRHRFGPTFALDRLSLDCVVVFDFIVYQIIARFI
jgi:hypothetical protein